MGEAYLGSKAIASLCQPLVGIMPPNDMYIETHLSSDDILKRKPPAMHNIGVGLAAAAIADFSCDYPVELIHGCCHEIDKDFLVYCDPPHLKSTRKAPKRYRYRCDYEEAGRVELLEILNALPCQVMECLEVCEYRLL